MPEPTPQNHTDARPTVDHDAELAALIEQFAEDLRARAGEIEAQLGAENFDGIRRIAHRIKGAAASYGFPQVGQTAQLVESTLRADPDIGRGCDDIRVLVEDLIRQCRSTDPGTDFQI